MCGRCVGVASRSACGCVGVGCCSGGAASARLGLVLVSARASTGRLAGALAGVSGCGLRGAQGSTFVRWDLEDSALATGSRHQCRSARVSAHEGRIVGALGGGMGSAHADSCVLRERRPENPSRRRSQPPGRGPLGAQDESKPRRRSPTRTRSRTDAAAGRARSRTNAAPPEHEPAPAQPPLQHEPHRRSRRSGEAASTHPLARCVGFTA